jgi:hypothetical protein
MVPLSRGTASREARCIVCERTGRWAVALRRAAAARQQAGQPLDGPALRLVQTRSLPDCWSALRAAPASAVVLEVTSTNLPAALDAATRMRRWFPSACLLVAAQRGLEEWEPLLREAGAALVTTSPRRLGGWVRAIERHAARVQTESESRAALPAELPLAELAERLAGSLPWPELASSTPGG